MRKIVRIVVHYSASPDVSVDTIRQWHLARGFNDIGYHRVIRKDGSIEPGRAESLMGAHTKGFNKESLGVCLTGNNQKWYPSKAQLKSLRASIDEWEGKYDISKDGVFLHKQLNKTSCPGRLTLKDIPPSKPSRKRRERMIQSGRKVGWPKVVSTDEVVIGNPHPSKTITVMVRRNNKKPVAMRIGPTTYQSVTQFTGYLNLRSWAVFDSELISK